MTYRITRTRVYEASSRHAPLPAVQFQVVIEEKNDFSLTWNEISTCLQQVSAVSTGGILAIKPPGDESLIAHFPNLVMSLLRHVGSVADYCKVQPCHESPGQDVFIAYEESETVLYAGEVATELLNAIWQADGVLAAAEVAGLGQVLDELLDFALPRRLDPNSRLLMQAAQQAGIPVINLDQPPFECSAPEHVIKNGYIQFGWGEYLQRCNGARPSGLFPDDVLERVNDRAQLLPLLQGGGIPVPGQDLEFVSRNQVRRAQRSAQRIGFPVMVCPRYGRTHEYRYAENNVFGPLHNDAQVECAVSQIREVVQTDVWIESFVAGDAYRFLVTGGELVAVAMLAAPSVSGDAEHSIGYLANRRAGQSANALEYRVWETLASGDAGENCRLQLAGLTLDSVPEQGTCIPLRAAGTFDNGGSCEDVTERVPECFRTLALRVAEVSGLSRLAGIDMVIRDLSGEAVLPNCAVTAVVPDPDLQAHAMTASGGPRPVASGLLGQLFPDGEDGRIPIAAITGTNGKTTTSRMVAAILQQAGYKVGLSCSDGVYVDGERILDIDSSGAKGASLVLVDADMEVGVLETARGGMATTGIAFDQCDVGACLNVAADHLGLNAIESLDAMAEHKRQVIERTTGVAVLNADDPRCLAMREYTQAQHIILVGKDAADPVITRHCEAGGTAVVLDQPGANARLCIRDDSGITPLLALRDIPATWDGLAFYNAENAMFAMAVAMGLGLGIAEITAGLRGFGMSEQQTPGRMNTFDGLPFQVILDYAHNAHGIQAFCEFTDQLAVKGRRILMMGAAADRSVAELEASAAAVAGHFDYYICRDPFELRGRKSGDIPEILKAGWLKNGVPADCIELCVDKERAVRRALEVADTGDLLVVFAGKYYVKAWDALKEYRDSLQHDRTVY